MPRLKLFDKNHCKAHSRYPRKNMNKKKCQNDEKITPEGLPSYKAPPTICRLLPCIRNFANV